MTTLRANATLEHLRLMELLQPRSLRCNMDNQLVQNEEDNGGDPILVRPTPCTYDKLFDTLCTIDFDHKSNRPRTLPPDLVEYVLSFLTVKRVKQEQVRATNSSSHDGIHPLAFCLYDHDSSWWLSSHGTMPGGRGQQWVQFQLSHNLRRLSSVSIKIPPMPQGPLSVREFCLQAFHLERGWHAITPRFQAQNIVGWQRFHFPDVDVDEVRLVCFSNQMEEYIKKLRESNPGDDNLLTQLGRFESVGFFSVRFE